MQFQDEQKADCSSTSILINSAPCCYVSVINRRPPNKTKEGVTASVNTVANKTVDQANIVADTTVAGANEVSQATVEGVENVAASAGFVNQGEYGMEQGGQGGEGY
ncbi:hypothetical protein WMY93_010446 [Mugilogobius chulae]|uniref:Gamma-synuclein n=1 Tax=Mugilogobius chulae TaxID=88201 RepID=A0AAW0P772_9GOBI